MPILDDDEIIQKFRTFSNEFIMSKQWWRDNEVYDNYAMDANDQWTQEDYNKYKSDGIPRITINKMSPIADSVAGFEIQNRSEAEYSGRLLDSQNNPQLQQKANAFSDTIDNGVKWMEKESYAPMEESESFRDMLVCGVGGTMDDISYSHNCAGLPVCRRIFPGFILYEAAARKKNLADSDMMAEARPIDRRTLQAEYPDIMGSQSSVGFDDVIFLQYFNSLQTQIPITMSYEFQWRLKEDYYCVTNPFFNYTDNSVNSMAVMQYAASAEQAYGFTLDDGVIGFSASDFSKFRKDCSALGVELDKPVKQKKYHYYRALLGGGRVLEKGECMSQEGFGIQCMTGKYDEIKQCFFGMFRAMKDPQRMENRTISDLQGFLQTSGKGGVIIEEEAVSDVKAFIRNYVKAKFVSVVKKGALSGGMIQQKTTAPLPQGLPELMQMSDDAIPATVGISPEFMGIMQSKDMTSDLQDRIVLQGLTILAVYFDAKKRHTLTRARLNVDKLRILAENNPGRLIPTADKKGYMQLFNDAISIDYDVDITDVPMSQNSKQKLFELLMNLVPQVPQILPLAMKYAPIEKSEEDMITQLLAPPPPQAPPPPDPLNQALIQSTIALNTANANKANTQANQMNATGLSDMQIAQVDYEQKQADVEDTKGDTLLKLFQAHASPEELANLKSDTLQKVANAHAAIHGTTAQVNAQNSVASLNRVQAHVALNPPAAPAVRTTPQQ